MNLLKLATVAHLEKVITEMMAKTVSRARKTYSIAIMTTSIQKTYVCQRRKKRTPNTTGTVSRRDMMTAGTRSVRLPFKPNHNPILQSMVYRSLIYTKI